MENKTTLIWKMAIASALSWEIAKLAGSHHPYLAPISVILCLQTTVNRSIRFSYHRMVGTIIGISVVVFFAPYLNVNGWSLGVLILIGSFIAKWFKRDETAIHQVALTVLLVFVMGHKSGEYPFDRFRDTLIGAIIAVLLHMLISPPNFTEQASKSIQQICTHLTTTFNQISDWVQTSLEINEGYNLQLKTKKLLQELHQVKNYIQVATDSLKYNPKAKKSEKELQECEQRIYYLTQGYTYVSAIVGILMAWSKAGTMTPFQQTLWAKQFKALSPFFQPKENPAELGPSCETLLVSLEPEFEKQQFHVALYHETISLLKKMDELPRNKV